MDFVKMEGLGNDFVVIEGAVPSADDIRTWCDRRTGVGADGVLRVTVSDQPDADIRMEYWNSDGSAAEMCGNGLRCVARYAFDRALVDAPEFVVETPIGLNRVTVLGRDRVRVELAPVKVLESLDVEGLQLTTASVGNPHAVTLVDDPGSAPVEACGTALQDHPAFPEGVNVEFVAVTEAGLKMRVWERGAGETRACGTGAAAAVAVAAHHGLVGLATQVELPGGLLDVEVIDDIAWLTGPANVAFAGELVLS